MVSDDIIDSVKRLVATRFPEMMGVEPDLAEEKSVLDGVLARKVMRKRPESAAGGEGKAAGAEPKVEGKPGGKAEGKAEQKSKVPGADAGGETCRIERRVFVASFKRVVAVGDRNVERIVRITFDSCGEILKIVTSK